MPITAGAVAQQVGGTLIGDPDIELRAIAPLDRAGEHELSFLAHPRYVGWYGGTRAGAVLVSPQLAESPGNPRARIIVEKPMDAMIQVLAHFHRKAPRTAGVHASAVVGNNVALGANVSVDPTAVIGEGCTLGDGTWIGAGAIVGAYCTIGRDVQVFPGAVVYPWVELGDRVTLHAGARVGREGFGFVPRDGVAVRIPHVGRCVLEHDVEIGANTCIDRGSVDDTIIGAGTKIDNLVHVAHNVRIGRGCLIAAQVGIAGSARIEDGVQFAGQVGVNGHITIGAGATLGGQSGVFGDVPPGETWSGHPARAHRETMRSIAALQRLTRMLHPLERLLRDAEKTT